MDLAPIKIWVDDERPRPDLDWLRYLNSKTTIFCLDLFQKAGAVVDTISLDHDLGGDDTTRPVVLWMCENNFWPLTVRVHTANPVGREWLEGMVNRYGPGVTR